jgi:RES domain-containing protein
MPVPLTELSGKFYRTIPVNQIDRVLAPPTPQSAGRYHRHGQRALYMSPNLDWARRAVSGYMREDMKPRFVFTLDVIGARVFDQRSLRSCRDIGVDRDLSNRPWRPALNEGKEPDSWQISDQIRELDADGLIDVSRHIPGGWHLVLFRWNAFGGPVVRVSGGPATVYPNPSGPKWS